MEGDPVTSRGRERGKVQLDRKQARQRDSSHELDWRLEADSQMRDTLLAA